MAQLEAVLMVVVTLQKCANVQCTSESESHLYKYFFLSVVYFLQPHLFDLASLVLGIEGGSFCLYFLPLVCNVCFPTT